MEAERRTTLLTTEAGRPVGFSCLVLLLLVFEELVPCVLSKRFPKAGEISSR